MQARIPYRFTAVHETTIKKHFSCSGHPRAAAVLVRLVYMAQRYRSRCVSATYAQLARDCQLDYRVVRECIVALEHAKVIKRVHEGTCRSSHDCPVWRVRKSKFDLNTNIWVPVPDLFIENYLPVYPNAVILVVVLFVQNFHSKNWCWPGVPYLSRLLGWSHRRSYQALETLRLRHRWAEIAPQLPVPLNMKTVFKKNTYLRRYRFSLIRYSRDGIPYLKEECSLEKREK